MFVPVDEARKAPGKPIGFVFSEPFEPIMFGGGQVVLSAPVSVNGNIIADAEGIAVRGELVAAFETSCARCLSPMTESINADFDVRYQKASDDDEVYIYQGDSLDISKMILDHVLLAIPISSVCEPECKGLCPVCGRELKLGDCGCVIED